MIGRTLLLLSAALLVGGCVSASVPAERPARIVGPTETSREELARAVTEALHVDEVALADDALTDSSVLVVERNRVRGLDNPPLAGRDLGAPERFRLVKQNERCLLVHDGSDRRFELRETTCVAE